MQLAHWAYGRAVGLIASRRDNRLVAGAARAARAYLSCFDNLSYDARRNGEARVLEAVAQDAPRCLFDVGANVGNWALRAGELMPGARIHCFEIVPDTAAELTARMRDRPQVVTNAYGLSDEEATVPVRHFPGFSEGSGMTAFDHGLPFEWRECRVRPGDAYCREQGIERIDLLKIDTEGADGQVLAGFGEMLGEARVGAVQFEYGRANILTRTLLADLYALLEGHGFRVGKIFPRAVDFRPYDLLDEDFRGPNYLAVHASRGALIARLAG